MLPLPLPSLVNESCGPKADRQDSQVMLRQRLLRPSLKDSCACADESAAHTRVAPRLCPVPKSARMIDCALDGGGRSSLAVAGTATYLPHYLAF